MKTLLRMAASIMRFWWLPALIVTISGLLQFGMPVTAEWLRLQSAMIREGEVWRLLTAHLVHLSWGHYLMNGMALIAICGLYMPWLKASILLWWCFISSLSVALGLLWLDPQLGWYVGLSGVLHGLLVAGGLHDILARRPMGILVLGGVFAKLLWEQMHGPLPGSETAAGGVVIVNAHLYGAVGGVLATTPTLARLLARSSSSKA